MRNRILALAFSVPLFGVLSYGSTQADENYSMESCGGGLEAVTTLPAPLDRWAQMRCTSAGYVMTGREGWIWIEPNHNALVVIPSQKFEEQADLSDNSSYFTKVEATKVSGEEFDRAYDVFHAGFDPKDAKPSAYRVDLTTMAGSDIRLYMFDYFTYAWGMACSKDACDPSSRFVMLNMKEDPRPLPAPI